MTIIETDDSSSEETTEEPDISETIQRMIYGPTMGAPMEDVMEVYMADYPEAQPDEYYLSEESK